ncbi:hypothetical protein HMPREF2678_09710 [Corynebacterium sp. HMSC058E07]|nr:hypothetical protein HMPREF2678_09710 [Corynebacterium sp. HMSC058E07]
MVGIGQSDVQRAGLVGHQIRAVQAGLWAQQPQHHRTTGDQQTQQHADNQRAPLAPQRIVSHPRIPNDQRKL